MVEPADWLVIEGESDAAPIDIIQPLDRLEVFGHYSRQISAALVVRPEPRRRARVVRACPDQIGGHRLSRRRRARLRARVADIEGYIQLLAGEVADIRAARELVLPVVTDDALVAIVAAAEEVPYGVAASLERQHAAQRMTRGERRTEAARDIVLNQVEVLDFARGVLVIDALVDLLGVLEEVGARVKLR